MFSWQIFFLLIQQKKIISLIINNTEGSAFQFLFKKGSVLLADFKQFALLVT